MITYLFLQRNPINMMTEELARVIRDKGAITWKGDEHDIASMKAFLRETRFLRINGKFDAKNPDHWKMLPELISGSRLWVAVA